MMRKTSQKDETATLKDNLLALIQKCIPEIPTPEEVSSFMQTGAIPSTWWGELFHQNISSEQLKEIRLLLEFIHDDFSDTSAKGKINLPDSEIQPVLGASDDLPQETAAVTIHETADNSPKKTVEQAQVTSTTKASPQKRKRSSTPSPWKVGSVKKAAPTEKTMLTESELAEKLFLGFIRSASREKVLDFNKLCVLVKQNLDGHSVSRSPTDNMLTLYDNMNQSAATFSAKGLDVIFT